MKNINEAVSDCLVDMDLQAFMKSYIHEVIQDKMFHVTFRSRTNGNVEVVICVEYSMEIGDLMEDDDWEGSVELEVIDRRGITEESAEIMCENLAFQIDPDYFDSDSEYDDESDDETMSIASQPLTPPPSRVRRA